MQLSFVALVEQSRERIPATGIEPRQTVKHLVPGGLEIYGMFWAEMNAKRWENETATEKEIM